MTKELMSLEEIEAIEIFIKLPGSSLSEPYKRLCDTARAAHRLQEEVGRLEDEYNKLFSLLGNAVDVNGQLRRQLACAVEIDGNLDEAFGILESTIAKLKTENEGLRKDGERLDFLQSIMSSKGGVWLLPSGSELAFMQIRSAGHTDNFKPVKGGIREAIDVAMKNGGDGA